MGTIFSSLDNCGSVGYSPAEYMEQEIQRTGRLKTSKQQVRKRMDITGTAMSQAMHDFKHLVGLKNLSDAEEIAENDEEYKDMAETAVNYLGKRKNSDTSVNTAYKKSRDDIYMDYLERKKREEQIRMKAKKQKAGGKLRNRKMVSNKKLNDLDQSSSQVKKIANPMGSFNPTGGILSSRKFGANGGLGQKSKVFQMGGNSKLLLETEEDETFDDNLSQGDVFVVGGQSEYDDNQSMLSIRKYDSQYEEGSDTMSLLEIRKANSSVYDDGSSQYTSSNVIVIGDGDSSYQGGYSDTQSETTIKQLGAGSHLGSRLRSRHGGGGRARGDSSHLIVDDYQSQGYGIDSEMDAQSMINDMESGHHNVFVEGDSDIIDEADDEMNQSFEKMRRNTKAKKPKSLDDFDGEEEEQQEMNKDDFLKGLYADKNLAGDDLMMKRVSIKEKRKPAVEDDIVKNRRNTVAGTFDLQQTLEKDLKKYNADQAFKEGEEDEEEEESDNGKNSKRRVTIDVSNAEDTPLAHKDEVNSIDNNLELSQGQILDGDSNASNNFNNLSQRSDSQPRQIIDSSQRQQETTDNESDDSYIEKLGSIEDENN